MANEIDHDYAAYVTDSTSQHSSLSGEHPASVSDQVNKFASIHAPPVFACPSVGKEFEPNEHKDDAINFGGQVPWFPVNRDGDGLGFLNSDVRTKDVSDGTPNTFLFLERKRYNGRDLTDETRINPFLWASHRHNGQVIFGYKAASPNIIITFTIGSHWRAPDAEHRVGINVAMCDGSTRFLADTISFPAYRATFTRSGGESETAQGLYPLDSSVKPGVTFPPKTVKNMRTKEQKKRLANYSTIAACMALCVLFCLTGFRIKPIQRCTCHWKIDDER